MAQLLLYNCYAKCREETKDYENPFHLSIGMFNLFKNKVKVLLYGNNNLHVASLMIGCMRGIHAPKRGCRQSNQSQPLYFGIVISLDLTQLALIKSRAKSRANSANRIATILAVWFLPSSRRFRSGVSGTNLNDNRTQIGLCQILGHNNNKSLGLNFIRLGKFNQDGIVSLSILRKNIFTTAVLDNIDHHLHQYHIMELVTPSFSIRQI